jgi:transposase-like protein
MKAKMKKNRFKPVVCPRCGKTMLRVTIHYMPYIKCGKEEYLCTCGRRLWVDPREEAEGADDNNG